MLTLRTVLALAVAVCVPALQARGAPGALTAGSLKALTASDRGDPVAADEVAVLGGKAKKDRTAVRLEGASVEKAGEGVRVTFAKPGGFVEAFAPRLGLPEDWRRFDRLVAEVTAGQRPVRVEVRVYTAGGSLAGVADLDAGEAGTVGVDLFDLVTISRGERVAPLAVRLTAEWEGEGERMVFWRGIALREAPEGFTTQPRFDRYGQRTSTTWPGKVTDEKAWRDALFIERELLSIHEGMPDRDRFGGWTDGPSFKATGFFRTEKGPGGRWWLVDPEGRPFWSIGVTGVRTVLNEARPVTPDNRFLFEALPPRTGPTAACYDARGNVSFYCWNVLRRYGSLEAWRDHTLERFRALGLNTIACWSEPIVWQGERRVPYTVFLTPKAEGVKRLPGHRAPDVFDPSYEEGLDRWFAAELPKYRDDPWLLGYFLGNEPKHDRLDLPWPEDPKERDAFLAKYLRQMFGTLTRLMKKHDPNHLYLGCRWAGNPRSPARQLDVPVIGEFVDVVSVNFYGLKADRDSLALYSKMAGGKPVMMTEHHLPLATPKKPDPPYPTFTAEFRQANTEQMIEDLASMPFVVGFHWYKYTDTGMAGFVDVTDMPALDVWNALTKGAYEMYRWHAAAK